MQLIYFFLLISKLVNVRIHVLVLVTYVVQVNFFFVHTYSCSVSSNDYMFIYSHNFGKCSTIYNSCWEQQCLVRITSGTTLRAYPKKCSPFPTLRVTVYTYCARPGWRRGTRSERRGVLSDSHRRRPFHGIPELEQEAERRLLGKQWPGTSVMRGCTPLSLQWVRVTSQLWLSFLSPSFRGHFWPLQWAFCPLPAFCQRLTLRVCSFFCLFFLSPLENKT